MPASVERAYFQQWLPRPVSSRAYARRLRLPPVFGALSASLAISALRVRSIKPSARFVASIPGVLPVPEAPTIAAQMVMGCDHDREAWTRRAVPIRLEAIAISGTATCAGVTPAPRAASWIHVLPFGR